MNIKYPLVSIRIAAFNHEKYILDTLNSVLHDTYPNKELVIINDGSEDATAILIEEWIKQHNTEIPIQYKTRENKGLTTTINELLDMCNGEYICGVASDDYLLENGISKRIEYLLKHPNKMAVFADCQMVNKNNNIIHQSTLKEYYNVNVSNYYNDENLKNEVISNWAIPGPVLMVNKKLYDVYKITYNQKLLVEDWDMYLKLVSKNLLGFVEYPVSAYRIHDTNTSIKYPNKIIYNRIKTIFYNLSYFGIKDKIRLFLVGFYLLYVVVRRYLAKIKNTLWIKNEK